MPEDVRCYIQCGSQEVFAYCQEQGYDERVRGGGRDAHRAIVRRVHQRGARRLAHADEVTISAINRNFPGRSGPGQLYLASPYTVAASAIAGYIRTFEPTAAVLASTPD